MDEQRDLWIGGVRPRGIFLIFRQSKTGDDNVDDGVALEVHYERNDERVKFVDEKPLPLSRIEVNFVSAKGVVATDATVAAVRSRYFDGELAFRRWVDPKIGRELWPNSEPVAVSLLYKSLEAAQKNDRGKAIGADLYTDTARGLSHWVEV